jgi:predicted nuclease of restriction endonuclease-like (RecB) superfamily
MSQLPDNYINILTRLKSQIQKARLKAALTANSVLLQLYWELGLGILELQQEEGWGTKVIDRLSVDLKSNFPDFKGLSVRNLKYMVRFAKSFPSFGQQAAAQIQGADSQLVTIVQQAVAQLPWGHLQVLMDKVSESNELNFYAKKCIENGWSRNILVEQINSNLFDRQGSAITNFSQTLPEIQSDLVKQTLKNPYLFDFLSLGEEAKERDLENALIGHIKQFMLELGRGFAYVGRQKNLVVQGDDFFLDLLFYNYNLHCFVVFELKVGDFKPEYAGKLNFYINTVNEQLKGHNDNPTIGVLLCKTPNETVVRYSLQGIESPIGVAEYQLAESLPKQLKGEMPSVEELESEIEKEVEELKSPTQKRFDALKERITQIKGAEIKQIATKTILYQIIDQSIQPFYNTLINRMAQFNEWFVSTPYNWQGENRYFKSLDQTLEHWKNEEFLRKNNQLHFSYQLNGFKKGGTETFNTGFNLSFIMDTYWYGFIVIGFNNGQPIIKKLYHEQLSSNEIDKMAETISQYVIDNIEKQIK